MKRAIIFLALIVIAAAAVFLFLSAGFEGKYARLTGINNEFGVDENVIAPYTVDSLNLYEEKLLELDEQFSDLTEGDRAMKEIIAIRIAVVETERNFVLAGKEIGLIDPNNPDCSPSGRVFTAAFFAANAKENGELAQQKLKDFNSKYGEFSNEALIGNENFKTTLDHLVVSGENLESSLKGLCFLLG